MDLISRGMNEDKMQLERRVAELISYWQANSIKKLCSTATFLQEIIDLPSTIIKDCQYLLRSQLYSEDNY